MSKEKLLRQLDKEILEFEKNVKVKERNRAYFITVMNYTYVRRLVETTNIINDRYAHIFMKDNFFGNLNYNSYMSRVNNNSELFEIIAENIEDEIRDYLCNELIVKLKLELKKYVNNTMLNKKFSQKELIEKSQRVAKKQEIIDTLTTFLLPIGIYELLLQVERPLKFLEKAKKELTLINVKEDYYSYLFQDNEELRSSLEVLI